MKIEFGLPCYATRYYEVDIPEEFIKDCQKNKMTFNTKIING